MIEGERPVPPTGRYDALVVGAGPNGLSAGIAIAQTGRSVLVVEGKDTVGGGARSAALTLPGFLHDVCSAVHPMAVGSPFFSTLPLADHGLDWVQPPAPLAHPLDDGTAVMLERSVAATAAGLGCDAAAYSSLFGPLVRDWPKLTADLLGPLRVPRHPLLTARFGLNGLRSALSVAQARFSGERARALFAGLAAHSVLPLERAISAAFGLVLGAARSCRRLADATRRVSANSRRPGLPSGLPRRSDRDGRAGGVLGGPALRSGHPPRHDAAAGHHDCRATPAPLLLAPAGGVPLRTWGL